MLLGLNYLISYKLCAWVRIAFNQYIYVYNTKGIYKQTTTLYSNLSLIITLSVSNNLIISDKLLFINKMLNNYNQLIISLTLINILDVIC